MKIYATTTSERASKGQGGNKFLDIDIQAGEGQVHVLRITMEYKEGENDKYGARVSFVSGDNMAILFNLRNEVNRAIDSMQRGEKKKGEGCEWCAGQPDCYHQGK